MAATEKNLYQGGASSVMYTDRRDFYVSPQVVKELWTDVAPFITITANTNFVTGLKDPQFKMFQHKNPWAKQMFRIETGQTATFADTAVTGVAPYAFNALTTIGYGTALPAAIVGSEFGVFADNGATVHAPTGERKGTVIIDTFTSVTSLGVKSTGTAAVIIANGDWFVYQGNAYGEGTVAAVPWADELSVVWGQCQIFKTSYQVTGSVKEAVLRGESKELERLRKQKSEQHKISKEKAFLFGSAPAYYNATFADGALTDANGNVIRKTMGIVEALLTYGNTSGDDQNIFSIPVATYSYADFVDQMEVAFQYLPEAGYKNMLASAKMLSYWSKLDGTNGLAGKSKWVVKISETRRDTLGFNYRNLETPHGDLHLIPCPSLTRSPYNGYGVIIDENNLQYMQYRADKFSQNIKTEDNFDGQKDEFTSDCGLGITLIESHKLFKIV